MRCIVFAVLLLVGFEQSARASSCVDLLRAAQIHEAAHDDDLAVRRYTEAVTLDATCERAWLGLATLRLRQGDGREAERVAAVAFEHLPTARIILVSLARARWLQGRREEAEHDLEAFVDRAPPDDARLFLRELAGWYASEGKVPAQLAAWRRLLALSNAESERREALTMVQALTVLVSHADPVTSPPSRSGLRRAAAEAAKKP